MSTNPAFIFVLRTSPWKDALGHAWELVCRGAEHGLFVADELSELVEHALPRQRQVPRSQAGSRQI